MKSLFKGFYNPNEELLRDIWNSDRSIFIFDTNLLLNIYQYEEKTKNEFLELLNRLKDRVWIPHQVALEYQRRRLNVIKRERDVFDKIDNAFNNFTSNLSKTIIKEHNVEEKLPELNTKIKEFIVSFDTLIEQFKKDAIIPQRELKPEVRQHDSVRDIVDSVFEGRVGEEFEQPELDEIYSDGQTRFAGKVPPGFKDESDKKGDEYRFNNKKYISMYGDLILWKQLLKKTKTEQIKKVVFVTGDTKEDWWYFVDKKMIGPLEELQTEFYRETEAEHFKMYTPVDFLTDAKKYINAEISAEAIMDVEKKNTENADEVSNINQKPISLETYIRNLLEGTSSAKNNEEAKSREHFMPTNKNGFFYIPSQTLSEDEFSDKYLTDISDYQDDVTKHDDIDEQDSDEDDSKN
ncbi:Uncharacterised protein [Serratia quinivorans]|nr:Uncharacterised protein [Serratia quinivorans]